MSNLELALRAVEKMESKVLFYRTLAKVQGKPYWKVLADNYAAEAARLRAEIEELYYQ